MRVRGAEKKNRGRKSTDQFNPCMVRFLLVPVCACVCNMKSVFFGRTITCQTWADKKRNTHEQTSPDVPVKANGHHLTRKFLFSGFLF